MSNCITILSLTADLFREDGQTDGRTDRRA